MSTLEPIMISALQHAAYCPRQCGLIHLEHVWDENTFTLRGSEVHRRTDEPTSGHIGGVWVERALPIWSERYGLVGKADTVEFWEAVDYPTPLPPPRETSHSRRGGDSVVVVAWPGSASTVCPHRSHRGLLPCR